MVPVPPIHGRGSAGQPANRFERLRFEADPEAADLDPEERVAPRTEFYLETADTIISTHDSPDLGFDTSVNPYRGCEHGCAYCYARPYHEHLGWSSGLDFETRIVVKANAPEILARELAAPAWRPRPIALSGVTDCYQPAERRFRLTRACLAILAACRNPVGLVTKSRLVVRDLDLLTEMAAWGGVRASVSITTLDVELAGALEPRAPRPAARLEAVRALATAGIPVGVNFAPLIPGLNDHEMAAVYAAAAAAGAWRAGYTVLRLPHAVKDVFLHWLEAHRPERRSTVEARIRALRGGALNQSEFGRRMRGEGPWAEAYQATSAVLTRRLHLDRPWPAPNLGRFRRPTGNQLELALEPGGS